MKRSRLVLVVTLVALLTATAAWSYGLMVSGQGEAAAAEADLVECQRLAGEIRQSSARPALAAERERLASEITGLVERAAQAAGITPDSLGRIAPEPPRRLGDSVYREKPTQVLLRKVTLRQVVTFVHSLLSSDPGLRAPSIRLTAPHEGEAADRWAAEVAVTYLIYDPSRTDKRGALQ